MFLYSELKPKYMPFSSPQVKADVRNIIDHNRCGIDGFFTDSDKASDEIIEYMKGLLQTPLVDIKKKAA
jgi:hypothetical protein